MSSKFFTWTKGDRTSAIAELKTNNKPPRLDTSRTSTASSKHSSRTTNSIALHDAAVKSATTLMTIMNDMLHSPQLSAHIQSSCAQFDKLADRNYRPRAYTAPSTPFVEFPSVLDMDPVELPGSLPEDSREYLLLDQTEPFGAYILTNNLDEKIGRSHSSPQEATWPLIARRGRMSVHSYYQDTASSHFNNRPLPSNRLGPAGDLLPSYCADEPKSRHCGALAKKFSKQDMLSRLPIEIPRTYNVSTSLSESLTRGFPDDPLQDVQNDKEALVRSGGVVALETNAEPALMELVSKMRASHAEHLRSVNETHRREIESYHSYISFLESRKKSRPGDQDGSFGQHKNNVDSEASLCQDLQAEIASARKERDELRASAQRKDQRILELKNVLYKTQENQKASQNAVASLEARLVTANNERTDVLEGFNEACAKLEELVKREQLLQQELRDLRHRLEISKSVREAQPPFDVPKPLRLKHKRTLSDVGAWTGTWPPASQPRSNAQAYENDRTLAKEQHEYLDAMDRIRLASSDSEDRLTGKRQHSFDSRRRQACKVVEPSVIASDVREPGLGILLAESTARPATPGSPYAQRSRVESTPPPRTSTVSSPPAIGTKTPMSTHKKLPKPPHLPSIEYSPPLTPSRHKAQRSEAFRSFSESMITSHAKDASSKNDLTAQPSFCNSTPQLLDATFVPLSRFTARAAMVSSACTQ